jgi:mRNA interferase MazF
VELAPPPALHLQRADPGGDRPILAVERNEIDGFLFLAQQVGLRAQSNEREWGTQYGLDELVAGFLRLRDVPPRATIGARPRLSPRSSACIHCVPARGDLVWLLFDPQAGHEQAGHRPTLVISPGSYNRRVGLAICCPVTSQVKGYPFEVPLPKGLGVEGAILSDQIKSVDWRVLRARRIARAPADVLEETVGKILALVDPDEAG